MADERDVGGFRRRVVIAAGTTAALLLLVFAAVHLLDVVLLLFAGTLLAVLLRGAAKWVQGRTHLRPGFSLALVIFLILGGLVVVVFLVAPGVADQFDLLAGELPKSLQLLRDRMQGNPVGRWLIGLAPPASDVKGRQLFGPLARFFSSAVGVLSAIVVIGFLSIYLAASPRMYLDGFVSLFPPEKRERTRAVLIETADTLRSWMLGQAVAMVFLGVVTGIGMWLLGIKLALALAVIAAVTNFVPYVGPLVSTVLAAVITLAQGTSEALAVTVLFLAAQTVESYIITPLIQEREASLPPAVTIVAQAILGAIAGVMGIILATPIAAAAMVIVRRVYVQGTLEPARP